MRTQLELPWSAKSLQARRRIGRAVLGTGGRSFHNQRSFHRDLEQLDIPNPNQGHQIHTASKRSQRMLQTPASSLEWPPPDQTLAAALPDHCATIHQWQSTF